ncbi:MAG: hypothetical protein ABSG28_11445 [Methanoregula sp.]
MSIKHDLGCSTNGYDEQQIAVNRKHPLEFLHGDKIPPWIERIIISPESDVFHDMHA